MTTDFVYAMTLTKQTWHQYSDLIVQYFVTLTYSQCSEIKTFCAEVILNIFVHRCNKVISHIIASVSYIGYVWEKYTLLQLPKKKKCNFLKTLLLHDNHLMAMYAYTVPHCHYALKIQNSPGLIGSSLIYNILFILWKCSVECTALYVSVSFFFVNLRVTTVLKNQTPFPVSVNKRNVLNSRDIYCAVTILVFVFHGSVS